MTVVIVTSIVGFIYIISIVLKNRLGLNRQERWYEIAVAGSIILVTGQLIGALCGVMFPIWFGSDTSDYSLSCRPISFSYEYNSTLCKYYDNMTSANATPDLIFTTKIYATNLHPLRDYNQQIYLEIITPKGINSSTADFAIKAGNYTTLSIYTYNKTALYPGKYTITVRGTGGDGKSRECKLFLDIYRLGILYSVGGTSRELTNISIKAIKSTDAGPQIMTVDQLKTTIRSRIEPDNPLVHEEAIRLAAKYPGDNTVDQLCSIYDTMIHGDGSLKGWSYVPDPRRIQYYSYANESLRAGRAIGCVGVGSNTDFVILMSAFAESIGATTRFILAYNETSNSGHAYAEVYLGQLSNRSSQVSDIIEWLKQKYNTDKIYCHVDGTTKDVWLNLDNEKDKKGNIHPGGPFFQGDARIIIKSDMDVRDPLNLPESS